MPHRGLIRSIIEEINNSGQGSNEQANLALTTLDNLELLTKFEVPVRLENVSSVYNLIDTRQTLSDSQYQKLVSYADFLYDLFCVGICENMDHDDPVASGVLLQDAVNAYRRIVKKRSGSSETFLLKLMDVTLLLGSLYVSSGSIALAKKYLFPVVRVGQLTDWELEKTLHSKLGEDTVSVKPILSQKLARAAAYASMIFEDEEEEEDGLSRPIVLKLSRMHFKKFFRFAITDNHVDFSLYPKILRDHVLLSDIYLSDGNNQKALDTLEDAISLASENLDQLEDVAEKDAKVWCTIARVYQRKAEVFATENLWSAALPIFYQAAEMIEKAVRCQPKNTKYRDYWAESLNSIAIAHGVEGDLLESKRGFLRAVDIRRKLVQTSAVYKPGLASCLNNFGTLMRNLGHLKVAKVFVEEALELMDQMPEDRRNQFDSIYQTLSIGLEGIEDSLKKEKLKRLSLRAPLPN